MNAASLSVKRSNSRCPFSTLLSGNDHGGTLVFDQEDDQLCRLCLAGIPSNDVNVIRCFIKGLSGFQGDLLSASHLHNYRPPKDIDKGLSVVPMNCISMPRRVFNPDHENFLAWHGGQVF